MSKLYMTNSQGHSYYPAVKALSVIGLVEDEPELISLYCVDTRQALKDWAQAEKHLLESLTACYGLEGCLELLSECFYTASPVSVTPDTMPLVTAEIKKLV